MNLICYNHGKYHKLHREKLGFFGFSIMKSKTIKRKAREAAGRRRETGRRLDASKRKNSERPSRGKKK